MRTLPHFLHDYKTASRSCWAVMDEFGNLLPCNQVTFWHLLPEIQVTTDWLA